MFFLDAVMLDRMKAVKVHDIMYNGIALKSQGPAQQT